MKGKLLFLFLVLSLSVNAQKPMQPLLDSIEAIMEKNKMPGVLLSITTKDSVIYAGGLGYANIDKEEKVTADHLFRMGSISKGFTALGLLKLESEGKLSLKDLVANIDPKAEGNWPVTIEQALEHTGGFDDMHFKAVYNLKDDTEPSTKDLIKLHATALKSRWKPGTRMSYSNPGYVLAGHMIEKTSEKPYADYLKNEVLDPIGMTSSYFAFKRPTSTLMTEGYTRQGGEPQVQNYVSIQGGPAGSLVSSANDMATYLMWIMSKGRGVIPEEKFDRFEKAETTLAAKKGLRGGYGLGNGNKWKRGYPFHGHNGGIDGFSSDYTYSREADIGVAVAVNSGSRPHLITNEVLKYFVEDKSTKTKLEPLPIPEGYASKHSGFFHNKAPRNQIMAFAEQMWNGHNVIFKGDTMFSTDLLNEWKDTLFYAGNDQFFFENSGMPHAMFIGEDVLWQFSDYAERNSLPMHWAKNIFVLLSLALVFPFLFYGFIWLPLSYIKNWKGRRTSRWVLWSACLSFVIFLVLIMYCGSVLSEKGTLHTASILLFVNSIIFFVLTFISLRQAFVMQTSSTFYRIFYWVTAIGLLVLASVMLANGFVGFKLWAY